MGLMTRATSDSAPEIVSKAFLPNGPDIRPLPLPNETVMEEAPPAPMKISSNVFLPNDPKKLLITKEGVLKRRQFSEEPKDSLTTKGRGKP